MNRRVALIVPLLAAALLAGSAGAIELVSDASPAASASVLSARPSRDITPGALNPDVTQDTVQDTICRRGWTASVRPSSTYTTDVKKRQIVLYGYADTKLGDYEEDHLIPLELGGAPRDEHNLWPEPITQAKLKDHDENSLHSAVCSGRVSLADARSRMLRDWGPSA